MDRLANYGKWPLGEGVGGFLSHVVNCDKSASGKRLIKLAQKKQTEPNPKQSICFVSSFLPQKCGIATFTNDLINAIGENTSDFSPFVVAMRGLEKVDYADPVKLEIRTNVEGDYRSAADHINFSQAKLACVQHEFGLFGGEQGNYLLLLMRKLRVPVITTLHTVLDQPNAAQREVLSEIADISHKVVVMSRQGLSMLQDVYGIPKSKAVHFPHGIPDLPLVNSNNYKHSLGLRDRKIVLTFGLISRNKGIEVMIKALPAIVAEDPAIVYAVVGVTHPNVKLADGEEYRLSLQRLVAKLGLEKHVVFYNHFVSPPELHQWLCAADFYVTPYLYPQQMTSGTLAFALGSGKAIISTPYWYAQELLEDGRGRLVDFGDSQAIAENIIKLLRNPRKCLAMRKQAYTLGRTMTWCNVGASYWKLMGEARRRRKTRAVVSEPLHEEIASVVDLPDLQLDHLIRLTDSVGLIQHAKFIVPAREHGYCTDDNARALEMIIKCYRNKEDKELLRLLNIYLGFVYHAQGADGSFQNFVTYDRKFVEPDIPGDALPRVLLGIGALVGNPPTPAYLPSAKDCFRRALQHVPVASIRGKAYTIVGLSYYLKRFPEETDIRELLRRNAQMVLAAFEERSSQDWIWFEDELTYDNAAAVQALFVAAQVCEEPVFMETAVKSCEFLLKHTYNGHHFSFVGNRGWFGRGGQKAQFDQQPIEASSTVAMLRAAYKATNNGKYARLMRKAFDWFLGDNDLQLPVYNLATGGCGDGLNADGVNTNQGAESLLSFLSALICVSQSYASRGPKERSK
jgi:glycosyltransferase involved in cell wall biosynthesis